MSKKNLRRVSWLVSAQTAWNVNKLAQIEGTTPGHIIDKLVRDRMVMLRGDNVKPMCGEGRPGWEWRGPQKEEYHA